MLEEKNLIDIYKEASNFFYTDRKNLSQKSKHWKSWYNFKNFNEDTLKNFRHSKNKLSSGLDATSNSFSFKIYSDLVNKTSESYVLNNLPKENIGNSDYAVPFKNVFVESGKLINIYWFSLIENKILKKEKIFNICEIGGGFGSFSELFIRNYNLKFLLIDLPEANLMCAYYLKCIFPNKNFYLFDDYSKTEFLSYSDFQKNDIIILPPNCNIDEKIKIDLFINTRSMMEMNRDVIKSYFDFIHKHSFEEGYFLNINRYEKSTVGYPVRISEYPYDNYWKVIISEPSFHQKKIHFLLTQRNFKDSEVDIISELNNLKKIEKKFTAKNFLIIKILRIIFGAKFLHKIGNFINKISYKLINTN